MVQHHRSPRASGTTPARSRRAGLLGLVLALGLTACGDDTSGEQAADGSTTTSSTLASMPAGDAAIEPGTYRIPRSAWNVTDFSVRFPEDWSVQYGHVFHKHQDEEDELGFYAVVVDEIFTDACHGEGVPQRVGPGVDGLVTALLEQPGAAVSDPVETTFAGLPATRLDFAVPSGLDLQECRFPEGGLQIWYSEPADKYFVLGPDSPASAFVLEVDGKRQVFLTQHGTTTSADDLAELQTILDSLRFDP